MEPRGLETELGLRLPRRGRYRITAPKDDCWLDYTHAESRLLPLRILVRVRACRLLS
jgi:hypothetical protein